MLFQIALPPVQGSGNSSRPATPGGHNNAVVDNGNDQDGFTGNSRVEGKKKDKNLFTKILWEGFKIGSTIGLSIIASSVLTPVGGMIVGGLVTAAFSAYEQYSEKVTIDFKRLGIEFSLGFISIGAGKIVTSGVSKIIGKKLSEKALLSAAVNSGAQGSFTGGALSAYDTYHETG